MVRGVKQKYELPYLSVLGHESFCRRFGFHLRFRFWRFWGVEIRARAPSRATAPVTIQETDVRLRLCVQKHQRLWQ